MNIKSEVGAAVWDSWPVGARMAIDSLEKRLRDTVQYVDFYRKRVQILEREQKFMRDPERTLVCDVLANGQLLSDPNGKRYGNRRNAKQVLCECRDPRTVWNGTLKQWTCDDCGKPANGKDGTFERSEV